tara:strand:- start:1628 stop:1891 length:264 start_codon:yes stop_codon:yes gene_type:complete
MATSRKTSESGAYMSQYDVEVDAEIKSLKKEIENLKKKVDSHKHSAPAPAKAAPVSSDLEQRIKNIEYVLRLNTQLNFDKLVKKLNG